MKRHIAATRHLPSRGYDDDWLPDPDGKNPHPDKFTRVTPKQQDRAYLRVLNDNISPTSEEHFKDRNACFGSVLRAIHGQKGARVRGLGNSKHNGRRGEELVDHETARRGGHRVKGPAQSARPLHPDAMRAMGEHREERLAKWVEMKRKDDERLEESLQ
jgi:hypothetical protein